MNSFHSLTLKPIKGFCGEVTLPGSKSLSNRILLLAAMSEGETLVSNLLLSDDTEHMLKALALLGVSIDLDQTNRSGLVRGLGKRFPKAVDGQSGLYLGNAGTVMRPLCAVLALSGAGPFTLSGEPRMHERPIEPLVTALRSMGAHVSYQGKDGYPPVFINKFTIPSRHSELHILLDGSLSSQYVTALLLALPMLDCSCLLELTGDLVSLPYIEITLATMSRFGVAVARPTERCFRFNGKESYVSPNQILVEGDASSASYFLAAGAIKGGPVKVCGISKESIQGDVAFVEVLERMGAEITFGRDWIEAKSDGNLTGVDLDLNHIPDAAMTLATAALFARGPTSIRNIYNWRLKETDRLAAMAKELGKVGAEVHEGRDHLVINPPKTIKSATIETYHDHRMAMCFSLAALGDAEMTILDPGCTSKTFPNYFKIFNALSSY